MFVCSSCSLLHPDIALVDPDLEDEEVDEEEPPPPGAEYTNYNPFLDPSSVVEYGGSLYLNLAAMLPNRDRR